MDKLLKILAEIRPDVDFEGEAGLVDEGILDSYDIASIISELDDEYGVAIRINELRPDNFNSVEAIYQLVQKLKET